MFHPNSTPRRFFGEPHYVTPFNAPDRLGPQFEAFQQHLEDMPLIKNECREWYELSGVYLGFRHLFKATRRGADQWDECWAEVKAFKQGECTEESLSDVALSLHCWEIFRDRQQARWKQETGYYAREWTKIQSNPARLEKRREQDKLTQRARRAKRREGLIRAQDAASLLPLAAE